MNNVSDQGPSLSCLAITAEDTMNTTRATVSQWNTFAGMLYERIA